MTKSVNPLLTDAQLVARRRFEARAAAARDSGRRLPCSLDPQRWDANDPGAARRVANTCAMSCPVFEHCKLLALAGGFTWGILAGKSADEWAAIAAAPVTEIAA